MLGPNRSGRERKEGRKGQKGRSSLSLTSLYFFLSWWVLSWLIVFLVSIYSGHFPKFCFSRQRGNNSELGLSYLHYCFLALRHWQGSYPLCASVSLSEEVEIIMVPSYRPIFPILGTHFQMNGLTSAQIQNVKISSFFPYKASSSSWISYFCKYIHSFYKHLLSAYYAASVVAKDPDVKSKVFAPKMLTIKWGR